MIIEHQTAIYTLLTPSNKLLNPTNQTQNFGSHRTHIRTDSMANSCFNVRAALGAVLLGLLLAAPTGGANAGKASFVRTRGTDFTLDGEPFLFNGFNSYWMMSVAADPSTRGKVTEVMRAAAASGLAVCRTWAFSDGTGYGALQTSPGVYDERVFQVEADLAITT